MPISESTLLPERIFGLSAMDGRRTVRPGEVVTFRFRAKNGSETTTPPALLVLVLPPGWSPLDALEAEIPPVAPGAEHTVGFRARPDVADATTATSPIQAALHLETLVLGSNVVQMRVVGRPKLDGPASGVRIVADAAGALRAGVIVVNEGDAAARLVRVAVPPPPGFAAAERAFVESCAELAVGASLAFSYTLVPLSPAAATVCIDDAYVSYDGGRAALATRTPALLAAEIAPPEIAAERRSTRLDVRVSIRNSGWVAARDVRCAVELPAGWRVLRGTMRADGAPPAIRRESEIENGVTVALPLVPARGGVDLTFVAGAARAKLDGAITVRCGDHVAVHPIPALAQRALRIDARPESAFAEPGTTVPIAVDVQNTGETPERVRVGIDGRTCWRGELRAGAAAAFVARYAVPAELGDGDAAPVAVVATADDGTQFASAQFELRAVDRPWISIEDVVPERGQTRVTIRNAGATAARDVRIDGAGEPLIARLAPGDTCSVIVEPAQARAASLVAHDGRAVPIGWHDEAAPVAVAVELTAPPQARSGERLDVRLRVTGEGAVQTLRVRPRHNTAAPYVAGSTSVNGHAVVEGPAGPPLFTDDGLALHAIPAGTVVELGWSLLPRAPGDLLVAVDVEANGNAVAVTPSAVTIADLPPFGARPGTLAFHIDAATVGDFSIAAPFAGEPGMLPQSAAPTGIDALPAAPDASDPGAFRLATPAGSTRTVAFDAVDPPALTTLLTLDAARAAAIVRVLRGARGPGLIGHVPSLALLFPDAIVTGDPELDAAFAGAAEAIRGVYERLFVKLRIPGYDVTPADLEDAAMRRDLLALFDRLGVSNDAAEGAPGYGDIHARIDRARIAAVRAALTDAPLGGPHALAAVAVLLPRYGSTEAAIAVGAYAGELTKAFEAACAHAPAAFPAYLTAQDVPELDAARAVAIAVLEARSRVMTP